MRILEIIVPVIFMIALGFGVHASTVNSMSKADLDRLSLATSSMPDSDIWLDVRAVELYFQVDRRRVYRLIESGRLPHERVGRKILISKQAASVALASPERKR